jgi:putative aldouronate transport system permease protein
MRSGFWTTFKRQRYLQAMALLGVAWMVVFNYVPMYGIVLAFKKNYLVTQKIFSLKFLATPWAASGGFAHFLNFFKDEQFVSVMTNTLGISVLKLLIAFPLPIVFALALNELRSNRFKRWVQTISYLPHFLSWVVLGGILTSWLSESGLFSELLVRSGAMPQGVNFLADAKYFWPVVIVSDVWKELGWSAIIYLAAIAGIDPELFEAATVDGAGRFTQIRKITLPCIKGTVTILFILAVGGILNSNFDQILVLWNPLNAPAANVLDIYVYHTAMKSMRFSYATAIGLFKAVVSFVLLFAANKVTSKLNDVSLF